MKRFTVVLGLIGLFAAAPGFAQECSLTIEGNDQIQFDKKELRVSSSCTEVTVTLRHVGKLAANVMGHNWVLTATEDYMAVAQAGQAAGPPNYTPANDERVIASTSVVGGGEETSVTFDLSKLEPGGDYTYFCSFPGHFVLMNGKFIVE
ncbi:MAG TPA: azurin [Gammaproteobacteria bacterium]